jgi:hypothetical protein
MTRERRTVRADPIRGNFAGLADAMQLKGPIAAVHRAWFVGLRPSRPWGGRADTLLQPPRGVLGRTPRSRRKTPESTLTPIRFCSLQSLQPRAAL